MRCEFPGSNGPVGKCGPNADVLVVTLDSLQRRSTADLTNWHSSGPLQIATANGTPGMAVTTTGLPRLFVRVEILP